MIQFGLGFEVQVWSSTGFHVRINFEFVERTTCSIASMSQSAARRLQYFAGIFLPVADIFARQMSIIGCSTSVQIFIPYFIASYLLKKNVVSVEICIRRTTSKDPTKKALFFFLLLRFTSYDFQQCDFGPHQSPCIHEIRRENDIQWLTNCRVNRHFSAKY